MKRGPIPNDVWEYAHYKNVSPDGCLTLKDVDYRVAMLRNISNGYERGWLFIPTCKAA